MSNFFDNLFSIDDDNYYFNSSLGISGIDSSLLEGFLD